MSYGSVRCMPKWESNILKGALSIRQDFFYSYASKNEYGVEDVFMSAPITNFVSSEFNTDYANDIFVNENGAVLDAYKLNCPEEEKQEILDKILLEKQAMFPEYELAFIPGSFPIDVVGGTMFEGVPTFEYPIMSTHVLYITNYEKILCKRKGK